MERFTKGGGSRQKDMLPPLFLCSCQGSSLAYSKIRCHHGGGGSLSRYSLSPRRFLKLERIFIQGCIKVPVPEEIDWRYEPFCPGPNGVLGDSDGMKRAVANKKKGQSDAARTLACSTIAVPLALMLPMPLLMAAISC